MASASEPDGDAPNTSQSNSHASTASQSFSRTLRQRYTYSPSSSPSQNRTLPPSRITKPIRALPKPKPPTAITNNLTDSLAPNLLVLFVGLNPGLTTASQGLAYAHPSNLFWKLLHSSGITPTLRKPQDDKKLPQELGLGFTNIITRPSRDGSTLGKGEYVTGAEEVDAKVGMWRPEVVCLVGKGVWEGYCSWKSKGRKSGKGKFVYGWREDSENMGLSITGRESEDGWKGARAFVSTTTSGLAAGMNLSEKQAVWAELGEWVLQRRKERAMEEGSDGK